MIPHPTQPVMIFRALAFAAFALTPLSLQAEDPKNLDLYLLVGQSNMAGRGTVTTEDQKPHPRIWMLNKDEAWVPAVDPMHFDKPKVVGVGLGRSFALALAEKDADAQIGLIPCAHGGSPIDVWVPGAFYKPTDGHPWDDAIRRAKVAMKSGTLKGILWHQGESDSKPELAASYEAKLHDLIARLRAELDAPQVPFIAGQMGQFQERPWSDDKNTVDQAHRTLPDKVPHTGFANSDGLKHRGDEVHFDSASYRELGRRYAEAFLKVTRSAE